ncbi:hypothetical protein LMG28138_02903 [Pararobbsia alpina]|uniref:Uncharacterized protein n=1 Tax=Pararobbsia alpina TaxID=621374 RepID=A0A6S7B917_9BURK|nr:hypothetical protein LMG28138_02903 [Pararobbsia alpina]
MTIENHKSLTEVRHGLREDDREAEISVLAGTRSIFRDSKERCVKRTTP